MYLASLGEQRPVASMRAEGTMSTVTTPSGKDRRRLGRHRGHAAAPAADARDRADPDHPGAVRRDVLRLALFPDLGQHARDGDGLRGRGHRRRRHDDPADLGRHRPLGRLGHGAGDGDRRPAVPRRIDPWVASAIAIAACTAIGAAMGFFVTRVGLHHFIVSLAVMVIARGAVPARHRGPAARSLHPAAGVQVHRPGLDRRHPVRHRHLRRRGRRLRLPAAAHDDVPKGVLHRQQREGGRLFRHPHQEGGVPDHHALLGAVRRGRHHLHGALRLGPADLRHRHGAQRHRRGGDRRRQPVGRSGHDLRRDPRHGPVVGGVELARACSTSRSTGRTSSADRSC